MQYTGAVMDKKSLVCAEFVERFLRCLSCSLSSLCVSSGIPWPETRRQGVTSSSP